MRPPVGWCVYCGSDKFEALSREHVVPFSLGGTLVIQKASCPDCAEITKEFEQTCARTIFGPLRLLLGLPSRHKKERPEEMRTVFEIDGQKHERFVKTEDNPAVRIPLPEFNFPGAFLGSPPAESFGAHKWRNMSFSAKDAGARVRRALAVLPDIDVNVGVWPPYPDPFPIIPFARMLAKIAHCYAVHEFGPKAFEPLLPDYILGNNKHLPFVVGSNPEVPPSIATPESNKGLHRFTAIRTDGDQLFGVSIHLLSPLKMPAYCVVIGRPGPAIVKRLRAAPVLLDL